jgi:hypothetical protein
VPRTGMDSAPRVVWEFALPPDGQRMAAKLSLRFTRYIGAPRSRRTSARRPDTVLYGNNCSLQTGLDTEFPEYLDHVCACGIGADE